MFGEYVEPREETIVGSEQIDAGIAGHELDARAMVHCAPDRRRHNEVAVGCEGASERRDRDVAPQVGCAGKDFVRVAIADLVTALEMEPLRGPREQPKGAAHREVAEKAGGCAARNLDTLQFLRGEAVPVQPAAEWIVLGHAVPQNEGPAGAG